MMTVILAAFQTLLIGCNSSVPTDRIVAEQPSSPPVTAPRNWHISTSSNPIDGTKTVVLETYATNHHDMLVIRLTGRKLEVYVTTGNIVQDEKASVRIKFDNDTPTKQTWDRSADYNGIFSPDPSGFVTRLQRSSEFYIEYDERWGHNE